MLVAKAFLSEWLHIQPSEIGPMTTSEISGLLLCAEKVAKREYDWRKTLLKSLGTKVK